MISRKDISPFLIMAAVFAAAYYLPIDWLRSSSRIAGAFWESLHLLKDYAREHVLLCLVPAFLIAGAIGVFVSQSAVIRYLGAGASRVLSYGVASVSGAVLAVCSCTVLPLFAGIYSRGAGLGPATTFLYSGPAINVLAVILTMRVLGPEIGIARAVGAVLFSIVTGLLMHMIFRGDEARRAEMHAGAPEEDGGRPLWQTGLYFLSLVLILVFANIARPDSPGGFWSALYSAKWILTSAAAAGLALVLSRWYELRLVHIIAAAIPAAAIALLLPGVPQAAFAAGTAGLVILAYRSGGETAEWVESTWGFARQILPLLFIGVLVAGAFLGRPGHEGLIPSRWVESAVGGNSLRANLFASVAGALMYFATLTEIPILQGLLGAGMGKGPALALLLAGPALSLPNMLVIRSVLGTRKTLVFVGIVVIMATTSGMIYGWLF